MAEAKYSDGFIAEVKSVYPQWRELHAAVDAGKQIVGRYLGDSCDRITVDEVLAATSLEELQDRAMDDEMRNYLQSVDWHALASKTIRDDDLEAHVEDDFAADALVACDQCGNIGTVDAWPFVQWCDLPSEGLGEGVMLCADCWEDAQAVIESEARGE